MKQREIILKAGAHVLDWVFPRRCPVCNRIVKPLGEKICAECKGQLDYVFEPKCKRCGKRLQHTEQEYCYDCVTKKHDYIQGAALYEYASVRQAIYRFKYAGQCEYADFFGEEIALFLGDQIRQWQVEALIPVPLHKSRQRLRGYNQAQLLAQVIGDRLQIPVQNDLVKRDKKTTPQKDLDETERHKNVKKAFKICRNDVKLKSVVVIDDIYTTGSTIDAMTHVLNEAGVDKVYFIALAIGQELL
ncbi:MAG: ComF family protein [Lachnospiraceae bacterium]